MKNNQKLKVGNVKIFFVLFILALTINIVSAATITTNVTETNINSSVLLTGEGFIPSTNYSIIPLLEEKSAWWDGFNEQWINENITIIVETNSTGGFEYIWYIPNDWRISGGKVRFKVGVSLASSLFWSNQGTNWAATQPTNNGIVGYGDNLYIGTVVTPANIGGVKKQNKDTGALLCQYNHAVLNGNINDLTTNGSIVYAVTATATTNIYRIQASNCGLIGSTTSAAGAALSVNIAPDNTFILITYASGYDPRKYDVTVDPPVEIATFAPTAVASAANDACISPNGSVVYIGYANGNVTALNSTGGIIWNSDPPETELGNAGYAFPINGVSCDNDRVYLARNSVTYPTGITNQGFVEALWTANGSRAWVHNFTDTIYDGMDVSNIKCDSAYCYATKLITPAPYLGIVGSAIVQINKTTGNVTWQNWRSWLPTTYNGSYGSLGAHSSAQTLWIDTNSTEGYIYPVYTNGWTQKIAKADLNASIIETDLWIRGLTNFWNYVADVPKNIWLSNETPYYTFRHWNQQGLPLQTNATQLVGTFFRYSMLNTFNSYTAYEHTAGSVLGHSLFIDPVIQTVVTQRNHIQFFWNTAPATATCTAARYGYVNLNGWYYEDRNCHYTEVPANATGFNIGTTINGTFITAVPYALIKTKVWEDYPITKYYGNDNWAWAAMYPTQTNTTQVLGFATKFGADQEDVYSDIYGRSVLFANYGTTTNRYYRPRFRADNNRKTDNYIFFLPKAPDGINTPVENTLWHRVDIETQKIANPVEINLSASESGSYTIGTVPANYGRRINFTAQEPNLFNRTNEPVEIIFTATGGIRSDCQDVIITNESDSQISLWQVDNSTACIEDDNVSVWIMMNWTQNETKNLRIYYNGSSATPSPTGSTDLTVVLAGGSCAGSNSQINVLSSNWYNWTNVSNAGASEITKFMFNDTTNTWNSTTHVTSAVCYKNSNTLLTGVGVATDTCTATPLAPAARCLMTGSTGKIFVKLNATAVLGAVTNANRPNTNRTVIVEYQLFANTGRVRIRTQLNESMPIINTTVSKNWAPYYYFSINNFIPPQGTDSWIYYSGLYEQMKKPRVTYSADLTEANLSSGPLPLIFTINYNGIDNFSQANGSIFRPADPEGEYWGEGCTAHKEWQYYAYAGGQSYGTSTAPVYTSEFISCSKDLALSLPEMGEPGYVNVIPEMAWDGTTVNRWAEPALIGKFYMQPNLYRPFNRENKYLPPYTQGVASTTYNPYATARISAYIIPVCPEKEYGYKGYDDFLADLPNLIANTEIHIKTTTSNIPCAAQIIKRTDQRGSDGTQIIFARNLSVIVGETRSAGTTYPYNTFASGAYTYQADGDLDLTFTQKGSYTAGYYGKWYFTYTPNNYVIDSFATSGNPQYTGIPMLSAAAGVAGIYAQRYSFAPEAYYTKNVFDESALWNRDAQNFTYYRNPCWLGRYNDKYGSTQLGSPDSATPSTPGWAHYAWGGASTYAHSTVCAFNEYNMEHQDVFRPSWSSKYPTSGDTVQLMELVIAGRENLQGIGTTPGATDTYAVAAHNSLFDYKHSDDYASVLNDINDLEEEEKHPNKQPWYCQISRHSNQSFCMMSSSMSNLIYQGTPGSLAAANGWTPYWSSVREMTTYRNAFNLRYFDASAWQIPTDQILEVSMYPTLTNDEMLLSNLLYVSKDADDYETFFRKQSGQAQEGIWQSQFLLKDWENSVFFVFDRDTRIYSPGSQMNLTGLAIRNGDYFSNKNFTISIYENDGTLVFENDSVASDQGGSFNISFNLQTNMSGGLHYVSFNYNNSEFTDSIEFMMTNLIATITNNKAAYEKGETVYTDVEITDSLTGELTEATQLVLNYLNPAGNTISCAKYPNTSIISNCSNNLTRTGEGLYSYIFPLGTNNYGVYTVRATITNAGNISADYTTQFIIALIDTCKPDSVYAYALNYPMIYDNSTDTITVIGNSTFGNQSSPITFENIYEFGQATKGTCIIDSPATGSYAVTSKLIVGNGTQEVYVESKGEAISFSSSAMPELTINPSAHLSFGGISNGIPQEGSSIKFKSNATNNILLDVAGGELAFYDSYVGDTGTAWGRFIYRGPCGNQSEEYSLTNSIITIKKTIFDRATRGQFFYTNNVTIDDMKLNRINSSSSPSYGIVSGCSMPSLNNLQIYHQEQEGAGISISENTPNNTDLIVQNSFLDYNNIDIIANKDGKGVTLVNTQWNRTYNFNWSDAWSGTTTIQESYGYLPNFIDISGQPVENLSIVLIDRLGNVQITQTTDVNGEIDEQIIKTWQVEKTISGETITSFNPYTFYGKKYGKKLISEPKSFATRTLEAKQVLDNSFTTKLAVQAAAIANITYTAPTKVSYGEESNSSWSTSGQLEHYPVDQCQYFAIFANDTKLNKDAGYTINYETGAITFLQDVTGYTILPVYYYGGNISITNGFTITNALSMNDVYDYMQYKTSLNELNEDVYTIDGSSYTFCINLIIGNSTTRGSLSDQDATLTFNDGYDSNFDGLGGLIDLAGITAGGGTNGGLPLNIFNNIGSTYNPGNTAYLFSTVMNSQGTLVDATVSISVYYPNGTLFSLGTSTRKSTGRFEKNISLPSDAPIGTWLANIDAMYLGTEVHDNLAFTVSNVENSTGEANVSIPSIQMDAPATINTNTPFGIVAFTKNANGLLVNCDSAPLLTLRDLANGSNILDAVSMSALATGQYNYTASLNYQSTFLALVNCNISSAPYTSNPKLVSTQNVATNNSQNSSGVVGSTYPTIDLSASTPIATSATASIGVLVKSASGTPVNCDDILGITIGNMATGISTSGSMNNFGTGMYNYSWTTPSTAGVFYINASCSISGVSYTGFTLLSTQQVGANISISMDYNTLATYIWNYTSRNLTYYNQSVADSIQSCLRDAQCSSWWINTTLTSINNILTQINSTANSIKNNADSLLLYFNCTQTNDVCTRLQSIITNVTDIQARVNSLNTTQIPNLQSSINNVYLDTQYVRTNMATLSALQNINDTLSSVALNMLNQSIFDSTITDLRARITEINLTTNEINLNTNCSESGNSNLCTYLNNINNTLNLINSNMATYTQISNITTNISWLIQNTITQTTFDSNINNIQNRLNEINTTTQNINTNIDCTNSFNYTLCTYLNNINNTINQINTNMATYTQVTAMNDNISWLTQNIVSSSAFDSNISNLFNRIDEINSTTQEISTSINCSTISSNLCTYLNNINNSVNQIDSNMATYTQISNITTNITWLIQNTITQTTFDSNINNIQNRLNEINTTTQEISTSINCSTISSNLCTYLNNINNTINLINSNMATYTQVQNISNNTQWIRDNVATEEALLDNFSSITAKLNEMNFTLAEVLNNINNDSNNSFPDLTQQLGDIQANLTWIMANVATESEISSNFSETFNKLLELNLSLGTMQNYLYYNLTNAIAEINLTTHNTTTYLYETLADTLTELNQTTHNSTSYLYTGIANLLTEINLTTHNTTTYLYTDVISRLSELNVTNQDMYSYLITNISLQLNQSSDSNLSEILDELYIIQSDILFVRNNMFYQGNATGSFLVDYVATAYTQPGKREELWILTRDLLGNEKTVSSAECNIMRQNTLLHNATVVISTGGVYAYWNIAANQTEGEYYWNCTLTGSTIHLQVPFFISNNLNPYFEINSLIAGSPRYPNEEALIEATFTNENGTSVDPDTISLIIYTPNGNAWATAGMQNFSKNSYNIWNYAKDIESNPTTGMYSVYMMATYNGINSSKTTQFRIATGGPYKVYLDCPTTLNVGTDLNCTAIIQDEGEAATESITSIWLDTNSNGVHDAGEPLMSFSKRTEPFQIVLENISLNIPANHLTGLFLVRAETSYVNSAQPNSTASDSVLLTTYQTPPPSVPSGGSRGRTESPAVVNNITQNESNNTGQIPSSEETNNNKYSEIICNAPYIRNGINCCLDKDENFICDSDERFPGQIITDSSAENASSTKTKLSDIIYSSKYLDISLLSLLFLIILIILLVIVIPLSIRNMKKALAPENSETKNSKTLPVKDENKKEKEDNKKETTPELKQETKEETKQETKEETKENMKEKTKDDIKEEIKKEIKKEITQEQNKETETHKKEEKIRTEKSEKENILEHKLDELKIETLKLEQELDSIEYITPLIKREPEAQGNERFFFDNGMILKNVSELVVALENMENDVFCKYVNKDKNDFSNWIDGALKQEELANKIKNVFDKKEMTKIIKEYINTDLN